MDRCPAMVWPAAVERRCDGCGAPLPRSCRRWCRDGCDDLYWTNHRFSRARQVALSRAVARYERSIGGHYWPVRWRCERCGCTTDHPEVNHRQPAMGAHAAESCIHHQENLEVLCRECHATETARQARMRATGRRPQPIYPQPAFPF